MKLILLILISFTQLALGSTNLSTPQETFKTYLKAMVRIKNGQGDINKNYDHAISTFNFEDRSDRNLAIKKADQLIKVIDKIKKVNYDEIPTELSNSEWFFDKRKSKDGDISISVIKIESKWFFSNKTFNSLNTYEELFKNKNIVSGVTPLKKVSDQIRNKLPKSLQGKIFFLESWQWIGIILILILAFIIEKIAKFGITFSLAHSSKIVKLSSPEKLSEAVNPLAKIIFIFTISKIIGFLGLDPSLTSILDRGLIIAMSIMSVWFGHKVIQYFADYFTVKAQTTATKFDDILIPLLTKTAFVIIYLLGGLLVLNSLTIDVTGLIAGLGIGGLAFAFAAKDTLANFFGSIMLVLDRPFDIGDIIQAGDIEGVVTEVGFRSTRIRTFNDSLITISNGELMNRSIDNKGKRRFRRLVTTLGLEYDTPPPKIEAFCEGIRQLILSHKYTRKDNFHVYFTNFGASSLDLQMVVYWKTEDYSRELAEKHRLMIDILRLADELQVSFAFPTQTVHMFNETKSDNTQFESEYLQAGIQRAKKLAEKPISLKNPRSNAEDKSQFGDNDIGND